MTTPPKIFLYKKYHSTFHIFPAMIPLIEILPWVLGLIGGAAGMTEFLREKIWHKPRVRWLTVTASLFLVVGISIFAVHQYRLPAKDTSIFVAPEAFSSLTTHPRVTSQITPATPSEFGLVWHQPAAGMLMGNAALTKDLLLVGTLDKKLEARSRIDGQRVWTLQKKEPVFTSALIAGDIGLIGEGLHTAPSATITAFTPETGKPLWERTFRSHVETAPAYDPDSGRIFQAAGAEGIWAIKLKTGAVDWHIPLGHIDVAPLYEDGALYVPAKLLEDKDGAAVFKLDADDGDEIWRTPVYGNPMGNILDAGNDTMILATAIGQVGLNKQSDKGWVHALDRQGKLLWSTELRAMPLPEGHVSKNLGLAFFALKNGDLIALDTRTGKEAWNASYGGEFQSDAALYEDGPTPLIAAVTKDGFVGIRNAADGKPLKGFKTAGGAYSSPLFADDMLYIFEAYGYAAYGPVSGLLKP